MEIRISGFLVLLERGAPQVTLPPCSSGQEDRGSWAWGPFRPSSTILPYFVALLVWTLQDLKSLVQAVLVGLIGNRSTDFTQ